MPTYHTGSVRYHVSDFLSDRHPYNPNTGSDTQRQREAGLVKNSHESIALDKLQDDLMALDDPNEKVKALRALNAHAAAAETKIVLLRKGIVARLAATLMQARKRANAIGKLGSTLDESASAAGANLPHIQQLQQFKISDPLLAWCTVEQVAAQLLRSLAVIPQGVHCVIEEGGWTALIASVADNSPQTLQYREQGRICAATAIALLTSTGVALNWLTSGGIDAPKDMELEGYAPWEAFYTEFAPLYSNGEGNSAPSSSSAAAALTTPDAIGTQMLDTIDAREKVLSAFFDTVAVCLAKDVPTPRLLLPLLDTVGNLLQHERCLHLALIAGTLRSVSTYMGATLLKDDLWLHSSNNNGGGGASSSGSAAALIKSADRNTATPQSAAADHAMPGAAPVKSATHIATSGPMIDIACKICNILWHIGLDSVGKQEVLELFQIVFQTGSLLQVLMKETNSTQLLNLKALVSGALGAMALLPDMKKMMTAKKDFPIVIPPNEESGLEVLNGNKDANGLGASFVDTLLDLLRQANELQKARFAGINGNGTNSGGGAPPAQRLSIADTALKRDVEAVITNTVATIRLIVELPATRAYLHSKVFLTNKPPVDVDGPALTIAAAQEGKEHDLRRQIFYSTKWEKEFKVYVY